MRISYISVPGHRVFPPVLLPQPGVATVGLDELTQARNSKLYTIMTAQAPDGWQLVALWQAHLVPNQGVGLGNGKLRLADILLEHLTRVSAELPLSLGHPVTEREGGVADGWDGELSTPGRHVRGGGDHGEGGCQLLLYIMLVHADKDVAVANHLATCCAHIPLTLSSLLIRLKTGKVSMPWVGHKALTMSLARQHTGISALELNMGREAINAIGQAAHSSLVP